MADQADERLKALKASMKEALGKLTGSDELEAQGKREKSGGGGKRNGRTAPKAEAPTQVETKARPSRRRP